MFSPIVIKYPNTWADAIKIVRILDKEWLDSHKEKHKIKRHKRLINVINIVKELFTAADKIEDEVHRNAIKNVLKNWARKRRVRVRL